MKYTIILLILIFIGCQKPIGESVVDTKKGYNIKVIDGCEYIEVDSGVGDYYRYTLTHKGNCKSCKKHDI